MPPMPPRILLFAVALLTLFALIPFAVIAWVRSAPSPGRPIHIIQDMDFQPRFNTQTVSYTHLTLPTTPYV